MRATIKPMFRRVVVLLAMFLLLIAALPAAVSAAECPPEICDNLAQLFARQDRTPKPTRTPRPTRVPRETTTPVPTQAPTLTPTTAPTVAPTSTLGPTNTPVAPSTATATGVPPTSTQTSVPTVTNTAVPPTATVVPPTATAVPPTATPPPGSPAYLLVVGNQLQDQTGSQVLLHGINRSGTEYMCTSGSSSAFDGPADQASIDAMKSWGINTVRVPLNEDCWLGINGFPGGFSADSYRSQISDYVGLLSDNGMYVVLELHWSAPGTQQARGQQPMPDMDHSPTFWTSVAQAFKDQPRVIFDLFNEPFPDNNQNTTAAWQCLRDGQAACPNLSYQAAGMQTLVNVIRGTGAYNVIMVPGVQYSNTLSQWLTYRPSDPLNNLAASWHSYAAQICNNQGCWDSQIAPVAAQVPLIAGEIGENDCAHGYIDALMAWLDGHNASYLGWAWNTYDCNGFPSLISNFDGTPTNFGVGLRDHLLALAGGSAPTATPAPTRTPTPPPTPTSGPPTATPPPTSTPPPAQAGQWTNVTPSNANLHDKLNCDNFGTTSMVVDPLKPSDLYTAFDCQGVWRSTDYGQTWQGPINTGTNASAPAGAGGVRIAPGVPGRPILYSATIRGPYTGFARSLDGGVNWQTFPTGIVPGREDYYAPVVDPYDGNHLIMAGHEMAVVAETFDGGQTWRRAPLNGGMSAGGTATLFFIDMGNASATRGTWLWMAQGTGGQVGTWRTTNSGASWTRVSNQEHPHGDGQIAQQGPVVFTAGIYAAGGWGVERSADYGVTWQHVGPSTNEGIAWIMGDRVYAGYGWACNCGVDPQIMSAPLPGLTGWTTPTRPPGMGEGPAMAAVTNDGTRNITVTANWAAGLWRLTTTGGSAPAAPAATLTPTAVAPTATPTPPVAASCGTSLQSMVNAAPAGSVVNVPACTYAETVTIEKPITLDGHGAATIDGGWTRERWFWVGSSDVTIRGFRMLNATTPPLYGGIGTQAGIQRVVIENNDMGPGRGGSALVAIGETTDSRVSGNQLHGGGSLGISTWRNTRLTINNNHIYGNNTAGIDPYWEAGGVKAVQDHGLTVSGNDVHDNWGPGLWVDIYATDVVISGNNVHHQQWNPIFFEISSGADIFGNTVWASPGGEGNWGCIVSSSSFDVDIYDNTCVDTLPLRAQLDNRDAPSGAGTYNVLRNNRLTRPSPAQATSWWQWNPGGPLVPGQNGNVDQGNTVSF